MTWRRVVLALALLAASSGVAACGGSEPDAPAPAAPGANVDPGASGVVGGSINRAKGAAADAESRDSQLEQQSTTP